MSKKKVSSAKKKTAKKTPTKKKARKKAASKKAIRKRIAAEFGGPSAEEFAMSPAAPWPWPFRPYQQQAYDAFNAGRQRQMLAWHRRAGKDIFGLSVARDQARKRVGSYVHCFPKYVQGKRALWQGIDPKKGARFIDIAFGDMEVARNNTDMHLQFHNGSTWQLAGSDNYDRIVGSNIVGVIFSEWALCDPRAWDYLRPMILENDGFVIFISTFRGRNHMWQMTQQLKDNPKWYVDVRDVTQTCDIDGNPIITLDDIEAERESGMSEALLQQEYFCNPEAVAEGAIYGKQTERLRGDPGRHNATWNPGRPVYAIWNFDLPIFASCLMVQPGTPQQVLSAETWNNVTLAEALANAMQKPFPIQQHFINGRHAELAGQLSDLCVHPQVIHEQSHLAVTTSSANYLDRCHIDKARCELLLDSLSGYVRRERFNAQAADLVFSELPAVSWHSQIALCLETWATWEYYSGDDEWHRKPDYSVMDRIARTIL